jgi:uncharacterized protein (TIGR00106 family)
MVVAEFSVTPVGLGHTSEKAVIEAAVAEVKRSGKDPRVGPFGTAIEAESLDEVFAVVKRAHEAAVREGAERVLLELRVDDRRDKIETVASQMKA